MSEVDLLTEKDRAVQAGEIDCLNFIVMEMSSRAVALQTQMLQLSSTV